MKKIILGSVILLVVMLTKSYCVECCNGVEYDPADEVCCDNQVVGKSWCCNNQVLESADTDCCKKVSPEEPYFTEVYCCQDNGIQLKMTIENLSDCPNRVARAGYTPTTNGCGSSTSTWVPDGYVVSVDFTGACDAHDRCYGTCNSSKLSCDAGLTADMMSACYSQLPWYYIFLLPNCQEWAVGYGAAVIAFGGGPYEDGQKAGCQCCP